MSHYTHAHHNRIPWIQKSVIWFSFPPAPSCRRDTSTFLAACCWEPGFFNTFFQVIFFRLESTSYRDLLCHKQLYLYVYTLSRLLFHRLLPVISLPNIISGLSTKGTCFPVDARALPVWTLELNLNADDARDTTCECLQYDACLSVVASILANVIL